MTKGKIDALLERLDGLGLGVDNGDAGYKQEPARSDALLVLVFSAPPYSTPTEPSLAP